MEFRVGDYVSLVLSGQTGRIIGQDKNADVWIVQTKYNPNGARILHKLLTLDYCHPQPLQEAARPLTQRQVASGRFDAPAVASDAVLSDDEIADQIADKQKQITDIKALLKCVQDDLAAANHELGKLRDMQWERRNPALAAINARRG